MLPWQISLNNKDIRIPSEQDGFGGGSEDWSYEQSVYNKFHTWISSCLSECQGVFADKTLKQTFYHKVHTDTASHWNVFEDDSSEKTESWMRRYSRNIYSVFHSGESAYAMTENKSAQMSDHKLYIPVLQH